jgi:hypothetical protein
MTAIVAPKSMLTALKQVKDRTEILDSKGQIIGFFFPHNQGRDKNHAWTIARIDSSEIERRKRSKEKGIPHSEVMRHMRLLDAEIERRAKAGERKLTGDEAAEFVRRLRRQKKRKQNH